MYQPPNQQPPIHPTPPLLPHQRLSSWFKRQSRRDRFLIGLAVLIVALCCTCSSIASVAGQHIQPVITPTSAVAQVNTSIPTRVPTKIPTPTPKSKPTPTPKPTQAPTPTPTSAPTQAPTGVNGNPWGYDFTPGNLIYSPNPGFCDGGYFDCVSTFWKDTSGYVVECADGKYSHSGGVRGACSRNGGVAATLYSH